VVESAGSRLRHLGDGVISTDAAMDLAERLAVLHRGLNALLAAWQPDEAAVEHTYVNKNPGAALKLGQARGVVLLAPALLGIPVAEYQAMEVKRAVVGTGHADKVQVADMVKRLLPGAALKRADAADALAVAICHAHHRATRAVLARAVGA
jgi:crossover junction endodeoxyribonuclease RuvC